MKNINLVLFLSIIFLFSCRTKQEGNTIDLSPTQKIIVLDSLQAATAIVKDEVDAFFDKVTLTEMQIQMKKNFQKNISRTDALKSYTEFMKTEVADFTQEEKEFVQDAMRETFKMCKKVNASIFPAEIKLIKTHANHYGFSVYYTRENCIVIPKNVLITQNEDAFIETMFHELFHIYSRYDANKRNELYQLIGFESIGNSADLIIDEALKSRILHNPDGINFAYKIYLQTTDNQNISCIPIIKANADGFIPSRSTFFNYLNFNLYEVQAEGDTYKVICDSEGNSTVDMDATNFYDKIKDNTSYIIHPDEVLADNFMFLLNDKRQGIYQRKYSEAGQQLLDDIEVILKE